MWNAGFFYGILDACVIALLGTLVALSMLFPRVARDTKVLALDQKSRRIAMEICVSPAPSA